jgi:hypothetical protein
MAKKVNFKKALELYGAKIAEKVIINTNAQDIY